MWLISSLDLSAHPGATAFMSDGMPVVNTPRNTTGSSYRLMIAPLGYLDITDIGTQPGGPAPDQLILAASDYWYAGSATLSLGITTIGVVQVTGDGNSFATRLTPFPSIAQSDIDTVDQMVAIAILPYQQLLPGDRPYEAVRDTALAFFAWSQDANQLGLAVYDWTTPDFFRMDVFNYFRFTEMVGAPLDGPNIVDAIWTTDWLPYQPSNGPFMHSMLMTPATSEQDVAQQYAQVNQQLLPYLDALKSVTAAALVAMPRTSILSVPTLYSGQVDIANLSENDFAVLFQQYPGNAGPPSLNMGMPLAQALSTFMSPGKVVNLKSFMSFTHSYDIAAQYSNGIIVVVSPQPPAECNWVWQQCAYVTPLSDEADKDEYLFLPGTKFMMGASWQETINGKSVTVIAMSVMS